MPLPRHVRLPQNRRTLLEKPVNGAFSFLDRPVALQPGVTRVEAEHSRYHKGGHGAVRRLVTRFFPRLRFHHPRVEFSVKLVDNKLPALVRVHVDGKVKELDPRKDSLSDEALFASIALVPAVKGEPKPEADRA